MSERPTADDVARQARWDERDRKREAFEAEMAAQAERHRQEHVKIVADAIRANVLANGGTGNEAFWNGWAEVAVDALLGAGVVFARLGSCEHSDGEAP